MRFSLLSARCSGVVLRLPTTSCIRHQHHNYFAHVFVSRVEKTALEQVSVPLLQFQVPIHNVQATKFVHRRTISSLILPFARRLTFIWPTTWMRRRWDVNELNTWFHEHKLATCTYGITVELTASTNTSLWLSLSLSPCLSISLSAPCIFAVSMCAVFNEAQ